MNKIGYLLFCLALIILSCNSKGPNISGKTIKSISKISPGLPSMYSQLFMFVSLGNDEIGCTDLNILNEVYSKYYLNRYKDFEMFLSDVLNQKRNLSHQELGNRNVSYFTLNKAISEKYRDHSVVGLINEYCIKKSETAWSIKTAYKGKSYLYSVLYFLFINNYSIVINDHIGEYSIVKNS